jgi:hypothetical protein
VTQTAALTFTLPDPIPTDPYLIAELVRQHRGIPEVEGQLYERVEAAVGASRIKSVWHAACAELDHDAALTAEVNALDKALADALANVERAQRAITSLTSGEAWHIEYAESTAGEDIAAHLAAAGLALRSARALRPAE